MLPLLPSAPTACFTFHPSNLQAEGRALLQGEAEQPHSSVCSTKCVLGGCTTELQVWVVSA